MSNWEDARPTSPDDFTTPTGIALRDLFAAFALEMGKGEAE